MPILGSSSFPRRNIEDLHSPLPLEMSILSCSGRGLAGKLEEIEHYLLLERGEAAFPHDDTEHFSTICFRNKGDQDIKTPTAPDFVRPSPITPDITLLWARATNVVKEPIVHFRPTSI